MLLRTFLDSRTGSLVLPEVNACEALLIRIFESDKEICSEVKGLSALLFGQGSRRQQIILQAFSEFLDAGNIIQTERFMPYVSRMNEPKTVIELDRLHRMRRDLTESCNCSPPSVVKTGKNSFDVISGETSLMNDKPESIFDGILERVQKIPNIALGRDLVSVIVPFLNGNRFFNEAVKSILDQTYRDWEILFVDDGSIDASSEKAFNLSTANPERIRYLKHPGHVNKGQAASRNLALEHAQGKYIAMLDIDDIWLPEKLTRQVDILERFPDAAMVYGPLVYWYGWTGRKEDMHRDFVSPHGTQHDILIMPPQQALHLVIFKDGLPAPSSALIRREILDTGIRFDESFGMYEDEVFLVQIALRYPIYLMSESFDRYRQHPDSFCAKAQRAGEYSPNRPNPSRGAFLCWLEKHVVDSGFDNDKLLRNKTTCRQVNS